MAEKCIELRHISKSFDGEKILDSLNLDIRENEFVTLLGPSGCGKTTTLRIMAGFVTPDEGQVLLQGKDIARVPANKRPINTVFQRYALFTHMNIEENIAFGLRIKKMSKSQIDEKVKWALKLVNLEGFEKRMPESLSGGQQQRIAIARAIVNEPKILLLDEPTKGMDGGFKVKFGAMLGELKKQGITTVLVSHDMEFCAEYATHCGLMFDREIISGGPTREFFAENVYYTTAAARMTRGILKDCLVAEDIMAALEKGRA